MLKIDLALRVRPLHGCCNHIPLYIANSDKVVILVYVGSEDRCKHVCMYCSADILTSSSVVRLLSYIFIEQIRSVATIRWLSCVVECYCSRL